MSARHVISVQANLGLAKVKRAAARGRSQNYMPPEAAEALKKAGVLNEKTGKSLVMPEAPDVKTKP